MRRAIIRCCDTVLWIVFLAALIVAGYLAWTLRIWVPRSEDNPIDPEKLKIFYICCGVTGGALVLSVLLCCCDRCCGNDGEKRSRRMQGTAFDVRDGDDTGRSFNSRTCRSPWGTGPNYVEFDSVGFTRSPVDTGVEWEEPAPSVPRGGAFV